MSAKVSWGSRSSPETASTRSSPSSIWPSNSASPEKPTAIFSPSNALVSGPPPSYGT